MTPPLVKNRTLAEAHFRARCAERGIPLSVERIRHMMSRMKPCWRRPGQGRVIVSVRFARDLLAQVVWDADIDAPVTAWWIARGVHEEREAHDSGWGG